MSLTVAYMTNRHNPEIRWFADSLRNQMRAREVSRVIIVDFWAQAMPNDGWSVEDMNKRLAFIANECNGLPLIITPPMPNVWSGPYRLPKDNWFSASASRNTSILYCETDWLAYCDDLSVLSPQWMDCVRDAIHGNYVAFGTYRKVRNLVVKDGLIESFDTPSIDTRIKQTTQDVSRCDGGWLYGCSLVGPLEAFLKVNGWPLFCDGLSSEDCCMGKCMQNAKCDLRFDRRMLTTESEEGHWREHGFKKADKGPAGTESDKSHRALRMSERATRFANGFDIRQLRAETLAGKPFDRVFGDTHDWFDGTYIGDAV
jgi:hypothetical protein